MKSYVKQFLSAAAGVALLAAAVTGCTREGDPSLGYEIVPENQKLAMRYKSFYADKVEKYDTESKTYDTESGKTFFDTRIFRTDSIVSSNLTTGYIGVQNDDDFGKRTAAFASEFLYMTSVKGDGLGYLPIFDSLQMILSVKAFGGDTTRVNTYEVYEICNMTLAESMEATNDGEQTAYINHDMEPLYDKSKRLFTFRFPDPEHGIYTNTTEVTATPDNLSADGATWDFVRRLLLVSDDEQWDGYADDTAIYGSDKKWIEAFKGLYIRPVDDLSDGEQGAMYAFDLAETGFMLWGRNRNPDEPKLIKDTLQLYYHFYYSKAKAGNTSINTVEHDYSAARSLLATASMTDDPDKTPEENRLSHTQSATGYLEGMGGTTMEICFDNDFLEELRNINDPAKEADGSDDFRYAAINQARLYIYIDGVEDYDWQNLNPSAITPLLDAAIPRLGLYLDYSTLTPVPDYNYVYEQQYNTSLAFGGTLNRSRACYVMDISAYIQRLKNYIDKLNPDNEPSFDYSGRFNDGDREYIPRTVYLAPEAYGLYTFDRTLVQGMNQNGNASMRIELTYTMIK